MLSLAIWSLVLNVANCVVHVDHRGNSTRSGLIILGGSEIERSETRRMHHPDGGRQSPSADRRSDNECDALVRGQEGWIFTPSYPSDYGAHSTCHYVVRRLTPDTCRVEMTLNDFDLEESEHCLADYLDLRDGQGGVMCGAVASGTKKNLQFRSGQYTMTLRFRTDKENSGKGFMIQLKQVPRSCGAAPNTPPSSCNQYVDTFTGSVTSPGYPSRYPPNLRCAYTLRRADPRICKVMLEIRQLDFGQTGPPCRGDYIEFPDLSRTCSGYPSRKMVDFLRGSDLLTFTFISDGYGSGKGFDIEVLQVPDSCSASPPPPPPRSLGGGVECDQEVSSITGHFTSPRFPSPYGPSERCRYTLRKADPSVCRVELDFRRFELEYGGPRCTKDYLTMPSLSRLCGSINGKQLMEVPKESEYVNLYFVSDAYGHGLGFDIHVTQLFNTCEGTRSQGPCDQEVGTYTGRFTSPAFPTSYPGEARCTYTVHRADPTVCSVDLVFSSTFDVDCGGDFLLMPDRARLCGNNPGTRILKFPAGSDILSLNFFSDAFRSGRGFDIEVTQRKNTCRVPASDCGGEVSSTAGRITSPGYPRFYTPGLRCHYRIRRPDPSTCTVELDFRVFDVATSAGCSEDYLQMPDQSRLCGRQAQGKSLDYSAVGSDVITLTFVTDSIGAGRGFDIVVRQLPNSCSILPPPPSCDVTIEDELSVLHSPGYPSDYPADALCVYTVRRLDSSVCQLRVEFLDFDVEEAEDCGSDFVQLERNGKRWCGTSGPPTTVLSFDDDILRMVFRSDSVSSRRGFEARIRQMRNSCYRPIGPSKCGGTYSSPVVTLETENFPLLYPADSQCEYRVRKTSPAVCQLELNFLHFDLAKGAESAALCDRDYLEVKGARYCGNRNGHRVLVDFPRDQEEIVLKFVSDSYQQLSGFRIEAKQLVSECATPPPPPIQNTTCEQVFSSETFQVISPGYQSGRYPDNSECAYTVRKSTFQVCALQVKFYTFDLEQSDDCTKDYLLVGEQSLCGRVEYDSVRTYEFLEDETVIKFHSDSFNSGAGFFLLFEQKTC